MFIVFSKQISSDKLLPVNKIVILLVNSYYNQS